MTLLDGVVPLGENTPTPMDEDEMEEPELEPRDDILLAQQADLALALQQEPAVLAVTAEQQQQADREMLEHATRLAAGVPGMLAHLPVRQEVLRNQIIGDFISRDESGETGESEDQEINRKRKRDSQEKEEQTRSKRSRWDVRPAASTDSTAPALAPPTLLSTPNLVTNSTPARNTATNTAPAAALAPLKANDCTDKTADTAQAPATAPAVPVTVRATPVSATSARTTANRDTSTADLPAQEHRRRERLEYQHKVQEQIRAQQARMHETRRDLNRKKEKKDSNLEKEKQRQVARQWWKQPTSSSTLAWVHSGGARGTSQGEVREWHRQANHSMTANANETVNLLNSTQEEIEELDLDQTLTLEEGQDDATARGEREDSGEKAKAKDGKGEGKKH